jgi:hypothetical protein
MLADNSLFHKFGSPRNDLFPFFEPYPIINFIQKLFIFGIDQNMKKIISDLKFILPGSDFIKIMFKEGVRSQTIILE